MLLALLSNPVQSPLDTLGEASYQIVLTNLMHGTLRKAKASEEQAGIGYPAVSAA